MNEGASGVAELITGNETVPSEAKAAMSDKNENSGAMGAVVFQDSTITTATGSPEDMVEMNGNPEDMAGMIGSNGAKARKWKGYQQCTQKG
jgi:hypothetical protein